MGFIFKHNVYFQSTKVLLIFSWQLEKVTTRNNFEIKTLAKQRNFYDYYSKLPYSNK